MVILQVEVVTDSATRKRTFGIADVGNEIVKFIKH